MNAAVSHVQDLAQRAHQEISKFKEGFEMKSAMRISKVDTRAHETLSAKAPAKFLRWLALGALLMMATVLPLSAVLADEPARPLSSEQNRCHPEISNDCLALPDHELSYNTAARALSDQQGYRIEGLEEFGIPWQIDDEGMVVEALMQAKVGSEQPLEW